VISVVYELCWIFIEKSIFSFKYAISSPSLFLIDPVFVCVVGKVFRITLLVCLSALGRISVQFVLLSVRSPSAEHTQALLIFFLPSAPAWDFRSRRH
jgi:hypothetical protein